MLSEERSIQLGPFNGGLNTYSQPGAIADNELVDCVNFILDTDGSLKCRPAIRRNYIGNALFNWKQIDMVGSAIISGTNYIFGSNETGIWYSTVGNSWILIAGTAGVHAQSCVQYKNEVFFVAQPLSAQPGGKWNGAAWTSIPAMPKGQACLIFKERMWIAPGKHAAGGNASRLNFSGIGDPSTWGGADFFDITPGDGSNLVDLLVFNNNLLLFKQGSTYYLSYDSAPAAATITKISNTIGASNWRCIAQYQNEIFTMHEDNVYQLVNFNWVKINQKLPFELDLTAPAWSPRVIHTFLSVVGDWLICRYHNRIYVYNILTQTWTRWYSIDDNLHNFGPFVQIPSDDLFNQNEAYYAGSVLETGTAIVRIYDGYDDVTIEGSPVSEPGIDCTLTTKIYSFDLPWKFKRLWSWGVEAITNKDVTGIVTPFAKSEPTGVTITIAPGTSNNLKRMYRFPKGLRFREVQFRVNLTSVGNTTDGLAQVYILLAAVKTAQTTPGSLN